MTELQGRVAAICGGTSGVGLAIGKAFVDDGASLVFSGRRPEKAVAALEILDAGDRAHFIQGDGLVREDCDGLIAETVDRFGKIDILVNCAGGSKDNAPVVDLSDEGMEFGLKVNYWSAFWLTRAALKHMIPANYGRIIYISSVEGKVGKPGLAQYVVGKHAVNALTKTVAKEVGTLGITVNALCAGAMDTPMMQEAGPPAAESMGITYDALLDWFAQESAIKRLVTVEDCAMVASLLVSEAGAGITGSMISIDGGTAPY
jgi:NAD(P)-dependent dehydrogenase (short-subunit alcohol dehydrogenase family)